MMHVLLHLSAAHWWSVLAWTIWSYFWIGLAEFLFLLPFYVLLRRRSPELRYNILLLWMALLCITPLYLLARVSHTLPANPPAVFTAAQAPLPVTITPENPIRSESPDSIPNLIPPDRKLDSMPTLIVPEQAISRMPGANLPNKPTTPRLSLPQIQVFPPSSSASDHPSTPWGAALIPWLPLFWMCGATLSFLLIGFGLVGAERFRRQATILTSGPLYDRCMQLAARLQIRGKILAGLCDRIGTPILLGIWRPLILLPLAAETGWPPDQLDMILLHELAHVRRFDNFVHLLQRLAEGLLFFQPAVWILSRWISLEREHCCDALVVRATGRPQDYARTLAQLALGEPFPANLAPSSAMARNHLLARIRRILNQEQSLQVSRSTLGLAASCLFLALLIVGALNAREISPVIAQAETGQPVSKSPLPIIQNSVSSSPESSNADTDWKKFTVTILGPDKKPLSSTLMTFVYYETGRNFVRMKYALSNAQGEIETDWPTTGVVNVAYPIFHSSSGLQDVAKDPMLQKLERELRRNLKPEFKSLSDHCPVKGVFYARSVPLLKNNTHFTVDFSECRSPVTIRFVDPPDQPLTSYSLNFRSDIKQVLNRTDRLFETLDYGFSMWLKPDAQNVLAMGKMNPGAFLISWLDREGHQWPAIPLQIKANESLDLVVKNWKKTGVEITSNGSTFQTGGTPADSSLLTINPQAKDQNPLSLTLLGPDKKPVPYALLQVIHAKFLKNSYVLTDQNGNAEVQVQNDSRVCVIYPPAWKLSFFSSKMQPDLSQIVAGKFPTGFQPGGDETPVKERVWIKDLNLEQTSGARHTIDLSVCSASLDLTFMDKDQHPVSTKQIDLLRIPDDDWELSRTIESGMQVPTLSLQTDQSGQIRLGKLLPGKYALKWFNDDKSQFGTEILLLEKDQTLSRTISLTAVGSASSSSKKTESEPEPESEDKTLSLTVLGLDRKPLPDALIAVIYKSTERSLERTRYAVSNAQGKITMNFPDEGLVNLVYPFWLGPPGTGLDSADPDTFKFEQNLRRVLGTRFKSLAEHFPVKDILYAKMVEMRKEQTTRCTVDLSDCRTPATLRFVDESSKPLKPQFLQLGPELKELVPHIDAMFDRSSFFYPLSLKIGEDGVLTLGKMNPGAFLISWEDPQQHSPHSIPLYIRENKPLDLKVAISQKPKVEVTPSAPETQPPAPPATPSPPPPNRVIESRSIPRGNDSAKELHLTVLGLDKKSLPGVLITTIFMASSEPQTFRGLSNAQGELVLKYPSDGIVHIAYPPTTGTRKIDQSESARRKSDEVYRKILGPEFKTLDEHIPVKNAVYLKAIPLTFSGTHATIDLSSCQTSLNLRFVDEQLNPVQPRYLRIGSVIGPNARLAEQYNPDRDAFSPIGTEVGEDGQLSIGKLNPGTYRMTWAGNRYYGGPQSAIIEVPQSTNKLDLVVKTHGSPRVEVYPDDQKSSTPHQRISAPLKLTILGPDRKPLSDALVRLVQSAGPRSYPDFALSNSEGHIEVHSTLPGVRAVCYPLEAAIPASDVYGDPQRRVSMEATLRTRLGDHFKSLDAHVPTKNVLWLGDLTQGEPGPHQVTVDLSQCTSQVELIFIDDQDRPIVPSSIELTRVMDRLVSEGRDQFDPNKFILKLKSDPQGHLSLGKMNPGKFQIRWKTTNPDRSWIDEFTVEPHTDIKRRFVIPEKDLATPAGSSTTQPASQPSAPAKKN